MDSLFPDLPDFTRVHYSSLKKAAPLGRIPVVYGIIPSVESQHRPGGRPGGCDPIPTPNPSQEGIISSTENASYSPPGRG